MGNSYLPNKPDAKPEPYLPEGVGAKEEKRVVISSPPPAFNTEQDIRIAAIEQAVRLASCQPSMVDPSVVLDYAKVFESYIIGENESGDKT